MRDMNMNISMETGITNIGQGRADVSSKSDSGEGDRNINYEKSRELYKKE